MKMRVSLKKLTRSVFGPYGLLTSRKIPEKNRMLRF